ncbi:hypothetical protein [Mucilaginibacter sp. AK015]|uniref:hypothetical protein n=1 Tax=Mucilaginibacter sp. AK015 TaxID=2723072 RepID=UPI00161574D4|nr:hypothetical protein [Mucilaginibacter sp. AK015]MBB5394157.1 hypothetical protein [Mucilaginibacter sp. AK015]
MKKILFTCFLTFAAIGGYAQTAPRKLSLNVTTGYGQQDLKWSIAGNLAGQNPNIYSELQWKKVGGVLLTATGEWNVWKRFMLTAGYANVFTTSGTVRDNDYNGDNRTNMVYDDLFDADKGYLRDWSIGAGYVLINKSRFTLNGYAGYNVSTQSLYILDRTGNISDLNSTYKASWKGPFVRAIGSLTISSKLNVNAGLQYNQANYSAAADWNLIQTFQHPVSYRHAANGFGIDGDLKLVYKLCDKLAIQAGGGYYNWQTGNGIDELFLSAGGSNKTQLNKAEREGYRLSAGVMIRW